MRDHRNLKAYQVGRKLVVDVYALTKRFPVSERYGLTGQMRRAAVSIVANLAEGCGRGTRRDFCRFLYMSLASARELQVMLVLTGDLGLAPDSEVGSVLESQDEAARLLFGLIRAQEEAL